MIQPRHRVALISLALAFCALLVLIHVWLAPDLADTGLLSLPAAYAYHLLLAVLSAVWQYRLIVTDKDLVTLWQKCRRK